MRIANKIFHVTVLLLIYFCDQHGGSYLCSVVTIALKRTVFGTDRQMNSSFN